MSADSNLALVGGTLYTDPTAEAMRDAVVLIADGTIAAVGTQSHPQIPQGARTLDCSGCTIVAGFWNSHVHFFERKWANAGEMPAVELDLQLQAFMRYGFTNVFDLSSLWQNTRRLRDRIESGEVIGPLIYSTGEGLIPVGGLPPSAVLGTLGLMETPLHEVTQAHEAEAAAIQLLENGVDGIKLFLSTPNAFPLERSAIAAAVDQAHRYSKPAFAHPSSGSDVIAALESGVDVIAHTTPRSGPWDLLLLTRARENNAALTPTLMAWKSMMRHDRASAAREIVDIAVGQLRAWREAGATVLFGTDFGAVDANPREEYMLMAQSGMGFREILASLTTAPADLFGEAHFRGRIAAGFPADLVILAGDPAEDVNALVSVRWTLRNGKILYRASLPTNDDLMGGAIGA